MTSTVQDRTGMPRLLADKLERIQARIRAQNAERAAERERKLAEAGYSPECVDALAEEAATIREEVEGSFTKSSTTPRAGRGTYAARLIERAQLALFEGEERGYFRQFPIEPSSEYPSILARVPIFMPGKRRRLLEGVDADGAIPFQTGWGTGRKIGPPLTIYDEDTLIAIMGLRQKQLVGVGKDLPVKTTMPLAPEAEVSVQVLFTTIGEIQEYLGLSTGGKDYKRRLSSVKRLNLTQIEFTHIADPALDSVIKKGTFSTKLIDLVTQEMDGESCLYIQLPPLMVHWLTRSYTYIDPKIRRELTDNGKAIHRFLASQKHFNIYVSKLHAITGTQLDHKNFMRALRETMKRLVELGWCEYEIVGSGRSAPYKLVGRRLKGKPCRDA